MIQQVPNIRLEPENFCYWLQGLLEDARLKSLDDVQVQMIREHLALVFMHAIPVPQVTTWTPAVQGPAQTVTVPRLEDYLTPRPVMIC